MKRLPGGAKGFGAPNTCWALNPLDGRAMSLGAVYLLDEGQTERAVQWSERALELYPNDTSSLGNGACLQARLVHADRAIELLERVPAQGWGQRDWRLPPLFQLR